MSMTKLQESFSDHISSYEGDVRFDAPLSAYCSFKIGGPAEILYTPKNEEALLAALRFAKAQGCPWKILGNGTNLLISDDGVPGLVLRIKDGLTDLSLGEYGEIACGAGVSLKKLCSFALEHSLTGLEFAYGIPGSAGGALYMNAGAYGGEMKDVVVYCDYLDADGSIRRMEKAEMELSYRHSVFTGSDRVILSVCFELSEGDTERITAEMNETMRKRREKQPLEYPSAGSTFKRPEGYFAAKLIEDSGLKGYTVGGAQVSEKHSGFVINRGGAAFGDVKQIIEDIKAKVYADSGVELECELITVE